MSCLWSPLCLGWLVSVVTSSIREHHPVWLSTLDAWLLRDSCPAAAARLLPALSVYMEFDFDHYWWKWRHDVPLPCWNREKVGGGKERERKSERETKSAQERNCLSPVFSSCLWRIRHIQTLQLVKCCYDVILRLFLAKNHAQNQHISGMLLEKTVQFWWVQCYPHRTLYSPSCSMLNCRCPPHEKHAVLLTQLSQSSPSEPLLSPCVSCAGFHWFPVNKGLVNRREMHQVVVRSSQWMGGGSFMPPCCWHKISPVIYCLWHGRWHIVWMWAGWRTERHDWSPQRWGRGPVGAVSAVSLWLSEERHKLHQGQQRAWMYTASTITCVNSLLYW